MERPDKLPLEYRLAQNEKIDAERKAWHQRKREESDEYREAYEFLEAQEKRIGDQISQVFQSINTVTSQIGQGVYAYPLKQKPEPKISQPLRQEPDIFNSPLAFGLLATMFLDTEAMQKALRRMELCKEIFDADMSFRRRLYPVSGWEV